MLKVTKSEPSELGLLVEDLPHMARFRVKSQPAHWWLKVVDGRQQEHRSVNLCTCVVWYNASDVVIEVLAPGESLVIGPDE